MNLENITIASPSEAAAPRMVRKNYPFVDLIRFISMMGVVMLHLPNQLISPAVNHIAVSIFFLQIAKFGTICFFIISGFLLGDRIETESALNFFKRRLAVVSRPWALAYILYWLAILSFKYIHHQPLHPVLELSKFFFGSHLWFVPNFLLSLLIICVFARYITSSVFGLILLLVSVINSYLITYNVHYLASHNTALLGFVFYLWLGVYIKRKNLVERIGQINPLWLILSTFSLYVLSSAEACWLYHSGIDNCLNTLRFSNQLYSLSCFALLVRLCNKAPNFGFFNPRQETYGVYLYHAFINFYLLPKVTIYINRYTGLKLFTHNVWIDIPIFILYFCICYFVTTLLVKLMLRFKLGYLKAA